MNAATTVCRALCPSSSLLSPPRTQGTFSTLFQIRKWPQIGRASSTNTAGFFYDVSQKFSPPSYSYGTFKVHKVDDYVLQVELNRPDRLNSLNREAWRELRECFDSIALDSDCRAVILSGIGKHFCAGIDLQDMTDITQLMGSDSDSARKGLRLRHKIRAYQESVSSIEKCPKPVIAAVHGACIGAGLNMISAADIRYSTEDAFFALKEVDIGIAADVGVLQRLPKIIGNESLVRELAFTARNFSGGEARKMGLLSRTFATRQEMISSAIDLAVLIAKKSPVAVQGTKINLNYSRDHTVEEGLDSMVNWQMSMLQSEDVMKAAMASTDRSGKTVPDFSDV